MGFSDRQIVLDSGANDTAVPRPAVSMIPLYEVCSNFKGKVCISRDEIIFEIKLQNKNVFPLHLEYFSFWQLFIIY
jgi:LEA14-like dessication related protein